MSIQQITVLGATGSIGNSTLSVIEQHPEAYQVFALSGFSQVDKLASLCQRFKPRYVVVPEEKATELAERLKGTSTEILTGEQGLVDVAQHRDVDTVMAAIVGAAGLPSTLAAVHAGKRVLLANKESLVMAGDLVMMAARTSGATILPVDSEHNAIFQCLPAHTEHTDARWVTDISSDDGISHISLTASGGPFLNWSLDQIASARVADACKHPNWSMGQKISVDSATMMNKGLELIEACVLFGVPESRIMVVIHPESVIHSAVHYTDGSVLAQLGNPDMCTPIAHALAWPERVSTRVEPLDFVALSQLNFLAPDDAKFPSLTLAREAASAGKSAPIVLNAANEVAVNAFLQGAISFLQIYALNEAMLSTHNVVECSDLSAILSVDAQTRQYATEWIASL